VGVQSGAKVPSLLYRMKVENSNRRYKFVISAL
jgi:hypothetical protein